VNCIIGDFVSLVNWKKPSFWKPLLVTEMEAHVNDYQNESLTTDRHA